MTKSENTRDYEALFWNGGEMSTVREEPEAKRLYDLEERTARFGEAIIDFAKTIPPSAVTNGGDDEARMTNDERIANDEV